uniref:Aspartokinase n=1 Tax=uncultured myxobacterium HF0200_19H16 TaxID=723559 RepID=E7C3X2_9BACT|nr:aspartokinases [uncultured myxobacterium HF0200_19H16]
MELVVQKYGGSSVGTPEKICHVASRVAKSAAEGRKVVVVVSAMQGETDRLLGLAGAISERPIPREIDQLLATGEQVSAALLAMALKELNVKAWSMTGSQMKMRTDGAFSRARIRSLDRDSIERHLDEGNVVVATGFQGVDEEGNLNTLGRGGSDTSAVALAAALDAHECEIYTDVEGVFTADPRICPNAQKIDEISFDEMMELASQGAKVLQIRSVELAMNHDVPIRVRSTFSDNPGTLVRSEDDSIEKLVVRGVSHNKNEVKITLRQVPDQPGIAAKVFTRLAKAQINVDVIVQNTSLDGHTDLSFTIGETDKGQAEDLIKAVGEEIGAKGHEIDASIAKVSIVGVGMRAHPGVAAEMFETLHQAGVNIQMITTSEIKVTCVIERGETEKAVVALHEAFSLGA